MQLLIKMPMLLLHTLLCLVLLQPTSYASTIPQELFSANSDMAPETNIKLSDVVQFESLGTRNAVGEKQILNIILHTKDNFKIYEDNLRFTIVPANNLPYPATYKTKVAPEKYFDPFAKKYKKIFYANNVFTLQTAQPLNLDDKVQIYVQACSTSVCLLPATLSLNITNGSISIDKKDANDFAPANTESVNNTVTTKNSSAANISTNEANTIESWNSYIAFKLQDYLTTQSFILFPILFLAGLLVNLTPCVYPMIPITLNVMAQFGSSGTTASKRRKKILPFIYVAGMVLTYSLLGVFAGMTGSIFGTQLANPIFNIVIALIMAVLGLMMLGVFNLSFVQTMASKVPHIHRHPTLSVAIMGALSGLIAAPCTGPVLSTILLLIAQNKDFISGFTYMLVFALGIGLPYAILGMLEQKFQRLPKFPRAVQFIKIFFASLMFALALYYLRNFIVQIPYVQLLFVAPDIKLVSILLLLTIIFTYFATARKIRGKIATSGLLLSCCLLSLWLTLALTKTFVNTTATANTNENSNTIHWVKSIKEAKQLAAQSNKPILVDIWAQWCVACLEMEKTTWPNPNLVQYLNENFVTLQLDFTETPKDLQDLLNIWGVNGLPSLVLFKNAAAFPNQPSKVLQGITNFTGIMENAEKIRN